MSLEKLCVKIYPHFGSEKPWGCVMLNPEHTSWQYELWDGSGRVVDLYPSPWEAVEALIQYKMSFE
jgi:hypothetical protein